MSRRTNRNLLRAQPAMASAVAEAKGNEMAAMAVADAEQEEAEVQYGRMMIDNFQVGQEYWFECAIWIYLGRVVAKGFDYIVLHDAARVPVDGRHNVMMREGCEKADGLELEKTGTPPEGEVFISVDAILAFCRWKHGIPKNSI